MKKYTLLLFCMLTFSSIILHCNPVTAYILVQRYEQLKKESKPSFKKQKLENFESQKKHYAALEKAMQKSIDLNF